MLVEELSEAQSALKRIQRISKYMAVILKAAVILFCLVWVAIIIALGLMALSFIPSNSAVEGNILSINAGSILGSALLLTMSFVFEYGVILQEFTDDTL